MATASPCERAEGTLSPQRARNERKPIYRSDSDRAHFRELLCEATDRFTLRLHGSVLMGNRYYVLVETPQANLSRAMPWLNLSYSLWFNCGHDCAGYGGGVCRYGPNHWISYVEARVRSNGKGHCLNTPRSWCLREW